MLPIQLILHKDHQATIKLLFNILQTIIQKKNQECQIHLPFPYSLMKLSNQEGDQAWNFRSWSS